MREFESLKEKYLQSLSLTEDPNMKWAKEQSELLNKSGISLNTYEGYLLYFFIKSNKCKKIVEIGTLTGYSSLWISKALPIDGQLWTIEKSPEHAEIARQTFEKSKDLRIHLVTGDAIEKLSELESQGPFDAVFIDGNKSAYLKYLHWTEKNLKTGGLLLADNTLLRGAVYSENSSSPFSKKQISIMNEFNSELANSGKFLSLLLPTEEGFTIAYKL
jgi:predicted O-methyltransferase YrrM